ncbi:MAG: iron-containing alcohol dehydrogenase [Micropepsaceae bacterium]
MYDRLYNTKARHGFHWPGRIVAGEGVLENWLKGERPRGLAIVADAAFADHPLVLAADAPLALVCREPRLADAEAILRRIAPANPETILAIGGGAALDIAKAVTAYLRHGAFAVRDVPRDGGAPSLVAAPTTAGSGSETSRFFILSDPATNTKISTRSWSLVPDLTLLDPGLLAGAPPRLLLLGAFDAAIHLWETFIARGERSSLTAALTLAHLPCILGLLPKIAASEPLAAAERLALMEASAMAGVAISNVRTGLIHTLGESLSAQVSLPHPATLRVFLAPVMALYEGAMEDHADPLWRMADAIAPSWTPWSGERFAAAWLDAFAALGVDAEIAAAFAASPPSLDALLAAAARDTTIAKENPTPLNDELLRLVAAAGLSVFQPPLSAPLPAAVNAY